MKKLDDSKLIFLLVFSLTIFLFSSCQDETSNPNSNNTISSVVKKNENGDIPTSYAETSSLKNIKTKDLIYAWVDKLNVRDKASLKGKAVASVSSNEALEFTGEKSGDMETIVLRGVTYENLWYKIVTKDGTSGWVFGGAVKRKAEQKGNDLITKTKFDFPYFGSFDLSTWKKLGNRTGDEEEVDVEITSYQKGNEILEITSSSMGEMYYGYDYKLMDKDKKLLKTRSFSFTGDGRMLEEKVKDYTTNQEYSRTQTLKNHWHKLNAKPMMVNGTWTSKNMKAQTNPNVGSTSSTSTSKVNISFNQKIDGYDAQVSWNPEKMEMGNVSGSAVITLTKGSTSFQIENAHFGLRSSKVDAEYNNDSKVTKVNDSSIKLNYKNFIMSDNKLDYPTMPLFFFDINFDGKKELLLTQPGKGQRGRTAFLVFDSNGSQLTEEPYNKFDSETRVNFSDKEIAFLSSGGACESIIELYEPKSGDLRLIRRLKQSMEDGNCMESTYKVFDGLETFVSKKELTN